MMDVQETSFLSKNHAAAVTVPVPVIELEQRCGDSVLRKRPFEVGRHGEFPV